MNRLVTTDLGGFPAFLNDIRYLDDAIREVLTGNALAWGDPAGYYILQGCEKTDIVGPGGIPQYQIAAGYVVLAGEVYRVNPHVVSALLPTPGFTYHWVVVESFAPDGDKTFKDGSSHQTHLNRRAKVVLAATPATSLGMEGIRLENLIARQVLTLAEVEQVDWVNPTLAAGWAFTPPGRQPFQYRVRRDGSIELRGHVRQLTGSGAFVTLPVAPAASRRLICSSQAGGAWGVCHVEWEPGTGDLKLLDGTATDYLSLEAILVP